MEQSLMFKLRELIQAEVEVGISGNEPDESGYRGSNRAERESADRIFRELLLMATDPNSPPRTIDPR